MKPGEPRRFVVPSRLDELAALRGEVRALALEHGFSAAAADDFQLCVHEAASNAILHGNRLDENEVVQVTITAEGPALRATVRNGGPGFDPRAAQESLGVGAERPRGRGMLLIAGLTEGMAWSDGGREVTFVKRP
jgi:serine/threonine-protein kinase RsbW